MPLGHFADEQSNARQGRLGFGSTETQRPGFEGGPRAAAIGEAIQKAEQILEQIEERWLSKN